jgi:hypothetical protein
LRRPRGFVLISVLIVSALVGALLLGLVEESQGQRTAVQHGTSNLLALEICEVGLVKAELEIVTRRDPDGDGIGNVSGSANGGTYEVTAERVPGVMRRWRLVGSGTHGLSTRRVEVGIRTRAGTFAYALFGRGLVELEGGGQTDSYDSRAGSYASQAVNGAGTFDGLYASANGMVGSNGNVRLWARTVVRGDAYPGPTGSFEGSPDKVWGTLSNLPEPADLPPPPLEDFLAALASNDNGKIDRTARGITYDPATYALTLGSQGNLVLSGGTYFFTTLDTRGGGTLKVTKPTTIYVTGNLDFGGGALVNTTGYAGNLVIYVHPYDIVPGFDPSTAGDIEMNGGTGSCFALYAPYKDIDAGGGNDIYGSIVGQVVHLQGGSHFHYDEALSEWGHGDGRLAERLYWVELGPLAP